jgi:hypothetical protein
LFQFTIPVHTAILPDCYQEVREGEGQFGPPFQGF